MSYRQSEAESRLKNARQECSKTGSGAFGMYGGIGSAVLLIILILMDQISGLEFGVGIVLAIGLGLYGADLVKRNKQAFEDIKRLEESAEAGKGSDI